jgi:hypothetical protein
VLGCAVNTLLCQCNEYLRLFNGAATKEYLDALDEDVHSCANVFFFKKTVPVLLKSVQSAYAPERAAALSNWERASKYCS